MRSHAALITLALLLGSGSAARADEPPTFDLSGPGLLVWGYDLTPGGPVGSLDSDLQAGGTAYASSRSATGHWWAQATMAQGLSLPELKLYAEATGNPQRTTTQAAARALQHFEYTGSGETTYTLRLTLDGIYQGTNGSAWAYLSMNLYGVDADGSGWVEPDAAAPVQLEAGADSISGNHYTLTGTMSFTVAAGGGFDLLSELGAHAIPGLHGWSIQDVSHTYSVQLLAGDAGLLVASVSAVPEPASLALLTAGLLAVAGCAGRARKPGLQDGIQP